MWCFPNERFKSKNIVKTTNYGGGSLMVWACFSKKDVGNIVKIDGKMTGAYVNIIRDNLQISIERIGLKNFIFQQAYFKDCEVVL